MMDSNLSNVVILKVLAFSTKTDAKKPLQLKCLRRQRKGWRGRLTPQIKTINN
jgi:hypothetical protein